MDNSNNNTNSSSSRSLSNILDQLPVYYSYTVVSFGIVSELCALCALFLRRRSLYDNTTMIYLFKWQYAIGAVFALNMLFNDPTFTQKLFGYAIFTTDQQQHNSSSSFSRVNVVICQLDRYLEKFIYCLAPWFQVVIALDRFWCIYLSTRVRIMRNKINLTILILIVASALLAVNVFNLWQTNSSNSGGGCWSRTGIDDWSFSFAQKCVYLLTRSVGPFVLVASLNVLLLIKLHEMKKHDSTNTVMFSTHSVLLKWERKRQLHLTLAVCIANAFFLLANTPLLIFFVLFVSVNLSQQQGGLIVKGIVISDSDMLANEQIVLLISYVFTLLEFWRDLAFNCLFRKEVVDFFLRLVRIKRPRRPSSQPI